MTRLFAVCQGRSMESPTALNSPGLARFCVLPSWSLDSRAPDILSRSAAPRANRQTVRTSAMNTSLSIMCSSTVLTLRQDALLFISLWEPPSGRPLSSLASTLLAYLLSRDMRQWCGLGDFQLLLAAKWSTFHTLKNHSKHLSVIHNCRWQWLARGWYC